MNLAVLFREITGEKGGRVPSFSEVHLLQTLELLYDIDGLGRQQLSRELNLGEGTTRTLIRRLSEINLVEASRGGMNLTDRGRAAIENIRTHYSTLKLQKTPMTLGLKNYVVSVKEASQFVKKGIEQRDRALIAGAKGATTLVCEKSQIHMPGYKEELDEEVLSLIKTEMGPHDGDVIIIGSDSEESKAELGAKAAALELLKLKNITVD